MKLNFLAFAAAVLIGPAPVSHPLTIDDVLAAVSIDSVERTPDMLAITVQRPASLHEIYGRTSYEVDPGRSDTWLVDRRTGARRNLTNGARDAAGFWCAKWSPDGQRLAMLSTRPEGREPRGGNNVRLFVWNRRSDKLTRVGDWAAMTQTRYGSAMHGLDLRTGSGEQPARCSREENAPFIWVDNHRLLAAALPKGEISGLLDQYSRAVRTVARDAQRVHDGREPTIEAVGSGAERTLPREQAELRLIDLTAHSDMPVASVPAYPFRGELTVSPSPDRRTLAILATTAMIPLRSGVSFPYSNDSWEVEKRLGFVPLAPSSLIHWASNSPRYPLELFGWSPDSSRVVFRGRAGFETTKTPAFIATTDGTVTPLTALSSIGDADAGWHWPHTPAFRWIDENSIAATPTGSVSERGWRLTGKSVTPLTTFPAKPKPETSAALPQTAELIETTPAATLWRDSTASGLFIKERLPTGVVRTLFDANTHLARVQWGEKRLIDYRSANGASLKAAIILPPGYIPGRRYPTIAWVYPRYMVRDLADYWLDPALPGLYNLQLYAAHGYVVVIPSVPLGKNSDTHSTLDDLSDGVLPAIDQLAALGITDPKRVGVMGQSGGGYAVFGLITRTNRFRAAVALAGISDLALLTGQFDPTARGYPGIADEASDNRAEAELSIWELGAPAFQAPIRYAIASPISRVSSVETPLLIVHGDQDVRGGIAQSEVFFSALARQGKTARLLRVGAESHSLAQSPANIRAVLAETLAWFDKYLTPLTSYYDRSRLPIRTQVERPISYGRR